MLGVFSTHEPHEPSSRNSGVIRSDFLSRPRRILLGFHFLMTEICV